LRFFRVLKVADVLAHDLHVGGVLEKPADRCHLDRARLGQRRQMAPLAARLPTVLPADDDQRAMCLHRDPK
jgi:hypothetical protein